MTSWKLVVLLSHGWKLLDDSWKLVVLHMSRVFRAGIRIEMESRVSSETSIGIRLVLDNSCICSDESKIEMTFVLNSSRARS